MSYKAVGFDYGGVIKGQPGSFFKAIIDLLGIDKEKYLDVYFHYNKRVNRGEISWAELWKLFLTDLGKLDKFDDVMQLDRTFFNNHTADLNHEMLALVDRLRAQGLKVGLLSNNDIETGKRMHNIGIDTHFNVFHISAETGLVKPEPEAFEHFAKELGVAPSELVFIDDSQNSLSTAQECGFTPVLFKSFDQLVAELTRLGVLEERA